MKKIIAILAILTIMVAGVGCSNSEDTTEETKTTTVTKELTQGDKSQGERPEGEKPQGERPEGEMPEGERPEGEMPEGEMPEGEIPEGERPESKDGHHHGEVNNEAFLASERITLDDGTTYTDGTYTGTGSGYGGDITVDVTIEDNEITNIDIVSHNETPNFYEEAFEEIPADVIDSQSTDVDTVSGATISSMGIILAIEDAISQAVAE